MKSNVQELIEQLEAGVSEVLSSERWREWLRLQARFHRYSATNTWLILLQQPDATRVAGFHTWKQMGRWVRSGEKGIRILAPLWKTKEHPETGEEVRVIVSYKRVTVFDVAQTSGKPLPKIGEELAGDSTAAKVLGQAMLEVIPLPVTEEEIPGSAKGYYHPIEHRIALQKGLSMDQRVKTLVHEYTHGLLHHKEAKRVPREHQEAVAEGVAFVVCHHFGIDTGQYSFDYVANWAQDVALVRAVSSEIQETACRIIDQVAPVLSGLSAA